MLNMQNLKRQIQEDMKNAMRTKESLRLSTIRMLIAAIKQREIDDRITLDNRGIISVINKMIKQRQESVKQYEAANRTELANKEKQEIALLQGYLPQQLTTTEIDTAVQDAIRMTGARSMQDLGKVMAVLKEKLAGRADMATVSAKVKANLSQ